MAYLIDDSVLDVVGERYNVVDKDFGDEDFEDVLRDAVRSMNEVSRLQHLADRNRRAAVLRRSALSVIAKRADVAEGELMTRREAAARIGVSVHTVARYITAGKLRTYKCGLLTRVLQRDVDRIVKSKRRSVDHV